jgi:hypothetical protein
MAKIVDKNKVSPKALTTKDVETFIHEGKEFWYDKKLLEDMRNFDLKTARPDPIPPITVYTGKYGMEELNRAMKKEAEGMFRPVLTEAVMRVMALNDPEENYDIPQSELAHIMQDHINTLSKSELKDLEKEVDRKRISMLSKKGLESHRFKFLDMGSEGMEGRNEYGESSTPSSPNHGGRLRPGVGLLEQIQESGSVTTYKLGGHSITMKDNPLFDGPSKSPFDVEKLKKQLEKLNKRK